jgi:hypothetical protein
MSENMAEQLRASAAELSDGAFPDEFSSNAVNAKIGVACSRMFKAAEIIQDASRLPALEDAIVKLNDALNELWGRDDCKDFAAPIGVRMLDKIMGAQNYAFSLVSRAQAAKQKETAAP